ncbi:DUF58 domain-containing protein [Marispirochaeta aestuarii]|uniref:DUF58 domain-containing protein n=1 Tax=Marispirochaeta aestuarii TaxID=1963862 RepID=UPI0029C8C9CD|nr:DUF58 domain-containing protein [Marispirochaeta aestuarii]
MKRAWTRVYRCFPLTILGFPAAAGLLGVLGRAFAAANAYAYFFSLTGLSLMGLLMLLSFLQARKIGEDEIVWHSRHRVFAGKEPAPHGLELKSSRLLPFFRVRFRLAGALKVEERYLGYHCQSGRFKPAEDFIVPMPLGLPHCGSFHAELALSVEDIFGLTRFCIGTPVSRLIPVLPGVLHRPVRYRIAERGAEEKSRVKESEVERYYMREYVPGDRFRDINWKASGRGDKLFTRISPVAQDESTTVTLWVRFYARDRRPSPALLALAEYQKSWVLTFLLRIKEEHPDFMFQVFMNRDEFLLENDEDLEAFATALGGKWFSAASDDLPPLPQEGRVYLFSSSADESAEHIRQLFPRVEFSLHLSRIARRDEGKTGIRISLFPVYRGEDMPSPAFLPGMFRKRGRLVQRMPGTDEEAVLIPLIGNREEPGP